METNQRPAGEPREPSHLGMRSAHESTTGLLLVCLPSARLPGFPGAHPVGEDSYWA